MLPKQAGEDDDVVEGERLDRLQPGYLGYVQDDTCDDDDDGDDTSDTEENTATNYSVSILHYYSVNKARACPGWKFLLSCLAFPFCTKC